MGGRKPTFLLGRLECNDTGIARGVFGWIWKKFGKPPSAWRGRKGWKYMMFSGKWGSSAFCEWPSGPEAREAGLLGVSHADCQRVSQQLSVILDVEELIPGAVGYTLEVSSPGMDRALRTPAEYERFRGRGICGWEGAGGVEGEGGADGGVAAGDDTEGEFGGGVLEEADSLQLTADSKEKEGTTQRSQRAQRTQRR
jgi:hypothetical protein